jgi:putative membrane protein
MEKRRTLVLSVDRDDDIGYKAGIESPLIGREACLNAATRLGLADPEDSDVNAIFQALKTYDELAAKGEDVIVAVIGGNHMNMLEGDRKIAAALTQIIHQTDATACILVSDGAEDDFILPIIQSRIPVESVRRVIVTQMPNLEGTYYILKKFLDDPKIARVVLIPTGLAMLLYSAAYLFGRPDMATFFVVGAVGTYLLFKGFGIDEFFGYFISSLQTSFQKGSFSFVAYISAVLIWIVGVIMGLTSLLVYYPLSEDAGVLLFIAAFIFGSVWWFVGGGLVAMTGKIIDCILNDQPALGRIVIVPFFIGAIGTIIYGASSYLLSISNVPDFPISADGGVQSIITFTIVGLVCALIGIYIKSATMTWVKDGKQSKRW